MASTLDAVASIVGAALLEMLPHAGSGDSVLTRFVRDLGWELETVPQVVRELDGAALGTAFAKVAAARRRLASTEEIAEAAGEVTLALADLVTTFAELPTRLASELPAAFVAATKIDQQFRTRLLDQSVCRYVERRQRYVVEVARFLGVASVEVREAQPNIFQPRYTHRELHWDRFVRMISDPRSLFADSLGWGTASLALETALAALLQVSIERDMPGRYVYPPKALADLPPVGAGLVVPVYEQPPLQVSVGLFPGRVEGGKAGLILMLAADGIATASIDIDDELGLDVEAELGAPLIALILHPDRAPELVAAPFGGGTPPIDGHLTATLRIGAASTPGATDRHAVIDIEPVKLEAESTYLRAGVARENDVSDAFVETGIKGGKLTVGFASDGVLSGLIPVDKLEVDADVALGWSLQRGVYFAGTGGLHLTIPAGRKIGPLTIDSFELGLEATDTALLGIAAIAGSVALGPVAITFGGLGLDVTATRDGGLGVGGLTLSGRTPNKIGILVDAPLVKGAGEIEHDSAAARYAGSLTLQIGPIGVRAIGALDAAKPPLSSPSFVLLASVEFPAVQLGFGVTLDGLGVLVGTERRVDVDQARAGLRSGQIAALLTGSPNSIAALELMFPPAQDRFVVGVYAKLGWGEVEVVDARVLPVIEFPSPIKIVLLATVQVGLPTLDDRVVDLRLDALGTFDPDRGMISIDGSLHDSKLAGYTISGDVALRFGEAIPQSLFSIGGFHPRFVPPPNFPALQRIQLTAGDNPQLRMSAYLALTLLSVQVGAQVDLTAHGGGFEVKAHIGFDALFELFPSLHFDVSIDANASISWHGHNLVGVALDLVLSGPHPYHAKGDASFSVLWWDVSVGFDHTWGNDSPAALPPPPDLDNVVRDALGRPEAWAGELPAGETSLLALVTDVDRDLYHPCASLAIRQRAVPLDQDVTVFASTPLPAAKRLSIKSVAFAGAGQTTTAIEDSFALGQFTQLSDDERLAAPTFELMHAGTRVGEDVVRIGPVSRSLLDIDTIVVDPLAPPQVPRPPITLKAGFTAVAGALRSPFGNARPVAPPRLVPLPYAIASTSDLTSVGTGSSTFATMRDTVQTLGRDRSSVQILPMAHISW